jgi:phosphate-selective porin OprO/OprP
MPAANLSANTVEDRLQAMERHMLELEKRLVRSEQENQRLRKTLAGKGPGAPAPEVADAEGTATGDVRLLNGKVASLEAKLEQDRKAVAEAARNAPKVEMGASGFSVKSADENYRLNLRGYAQADGNFFRDDSTGGAVTDKFQIRRARPTLDGTLFKHADFRLSPDFGSGYVRLFHAFVSS